MPGVSVIIPAYSGTDDLGEAIQSVLSQSYEDLEVIVVEDASPRDCLDIVSGFSDPRVKYLRHDHNRGAVAARFTGVRASSSDIIAFLDQDDLFHKEKLRTHYEMLQANPTTGATYNDRFEIEDASENITGLRCAPRSLTLADLVQGYPVAPSDIVLRREWALRDEIWDDSFARHADHVIFNGQEIVFGGRLALAGCRFGSANRALNYRRFHSRRFQKHLAARWMSERACQDLIFADARCPADVRALRGVAYANIDLMWSFTAYAQGEVQLAQECLESAVRHNPSLVVGQPCGLLMAWATWVGKDSARLGVEPEVLVRLIFENLPADLYSLRSQEGWVIRVAHSWRGLRAGMWGTYEKAWGCLELAKRSGAIIDSAIARMFMGEMLSYEAEFGATATRKTLHRLTTQLNLLGLRREARTLAGHYWLSRAFRRYETQDHTQVTVSILRGVLADVRLLSHRGVLSVLLRSLVSTWRNGIAQ